MLNYMEIKAILSDIRKKKFDFPKQAHVSKILHIRDAKIPPRALCSGGYYLPAIVTYTSFVYGSFGGVGNGFTRD